MEGVSGSPPGDEPLEGSMTEENAEFRIQSLSDLRMAAFYSRLVKPGDSLAVAVAAMQAVAKLSSCKAGSSPRLVLGLRRPIKCGEHEWAEYVASIRPEGNPSRLSTLRVYAVRGSIVIDT
jgi:hypothetical protein